MVGGRAAYAAGAGLTALFLTIATPHGVRAQAGTISGTVVDSATRRPLEGVRITIEGTGLSALSLANGSFTLLSVPPGTHVVSARRIGYRPREYTNVAIRVDMLRRLDFAMVESTVLDPVRVEAPPPPLFEGRVVGADVSITAEQIGSLPAIDIGEILALMPGYFELPRSASLVSLAEERRGAPPPVSVRGGRDGATAQLVDGVPILNPVFGSTALETNLLAISAVNFSPGYVEPQYGGGVSGMVQQVVREGNDFLQGGVDYQTTSVAGMLGSQADGASGSHHLRGWMSGPLPFASQKLRYTIAGQLRTAKHTVSKFPDTTSGFSSPNNQTDVDGGTILARGWRGFGANDMDQITGKVTYVPTSNLKLSLTGVNQVRRIVRYDRRFLVAYNDGLSRTAALLDSLGLAPGLSAAGLVQGTVRDATNLVSARIERRFTRSNLSFSFGLTGGERQTCNLWQGVCVADRFYRPAALETGVFGPLENAEVPYTGTDLYFGGETYTSRTFRMDYVSQVTDHHRIQVGAHTTRHSLSFLEFTAVDGDLGFVEIVGNRYRAGPTETATYVQDVIEYDFLSLGFGLRFDHGAAKGLGLVNPLHATNRYSAREVCNGEAPGINTVPFTYDGNSGILACIASPLNERDRPVLLDSATRLAQLDDFKEAEPYGAVSPRIGVSFPLTERSALFLNAGRYTKHPMYHDVYRHTGVGTVAGFGPGTDNHCDERDVKPGTNECGPTLAFHPDQAEYLGNPNLSNEQATTFEVGYSSQVGNDYAITATVYSTEQNALTSLRESEKYQDIGSTYLPRSTLFYRAVINSDNVTARGLTVTFRRRVANNWGFNANYSWSTVSELGLPPSVLAENEYQEEPTLPPRVERTSPRSRTHSVNVSLILQHRRDVPRFWGAGPLLRNTRISTTTSWSGGLSSPAPEPTTGGGVAPPGPQTSAPSPVNVLYSKDLMVGTTRYGMFVRATNIFNSQACCGAGSTLDERRRLAQGLPLLGPQERINLRRFNTGLTVTF